MILIWDNGHEYSDHAIYFIETLDYDVDDCLKLLKAYQLGGGLLAKAHQVEWFEGEAINIDEFISYWSLDDRSVIYEINPRLLKSLYQKWKSFEEDLLKRAEESGNKKWYGNVKRRYDTEFVILERHITECLKG